jgi:transcription elongation factor GreB
MSKAFTSEETAEAPVIVSARAPMPAGVPNYVTRRGLALLRAELATLDEERAHAQAATDAAARLPAINVRLGALAARIGSAVEVDESAQPPDEVRFGATVTVSDEGGGRHRYKIVGVDEANAREGRVAFVSPVARALLGRRVGDTVLLRTPRGEEELEVLEIGYASEAA